MHSNKNHNLSLILVPIVIAIILVTLSSSSFIHDRILLWDSAVFQLTGRMWADGYVPYKDIWELKGPAIFIPSAIGYGLFHSNIGLYLIEVINLSITFFFVLKTFLLEFDKKKAIFYTGITAIYYSALFTANSVEEYYMPLLTLSFYLLYKYLYKNEDSAIRTFPPLFAFVFGLSLGYCLMSRLTNAVGICAATLVLSMMLLKYKEWANLLKCAAAFIAGFLVMTVPFFLYFYVNDALDEMWYGTFLFGLEYSSNSGFDIISLHGARHILLRMANLYLLFFAAILIIRDNKQSLFTGILWLTVALLSTVMFLRLNSFGHYYQITLPYTIAIFIELNKLYKQTQNKRYLLYSKIAVYVFVFLGIVGAVNDIKHYFTLFHDYKEKEYAVYEGIISRLPEDYKDSFQAYDCDTELYLYFGINPAYPLPGGQSLIAHYGGSIVEKYQTMFRDGNAKYVLVYNTADPVVQDILNTRYDLLFTSKSTRGGDYHMYRLKDPE